MPSELTRYSQGKDRTRAARLPREKGQLAHCSVTHVSPLDWKGVILGTRVGGKAGQLVPIKLGSLRIP